jgi:antitoxin HigA-1
MDINLSLIKGIHPGLILERELKKKKLAKGKFALSIDEFPQTLVAIIKGKRRMNPALSLKIEQAFDWEEGFLMVLQVYYDIEQEKKEQTKTDHPDLSKIRPIIFWDTNIASINWQKNKQAIINRIFERGNEQGITEIIRFYGKDVVLATLDSNQSELPSMIENKQKYLTAS